MSWNSRCNCRSLSFTEITWLCFESSSVTVDDIRFKSQEKYVQLSLNFISIHSLSHKTFHSSLYLFTMFKLARCMPCSFFCSLREVTNKNLHLVLCFDKNNFSWQAAEIRLPYHISTIRAKWLTLITIYLVILMKCNKKNCHSVEIQYHLTSHCTIQLCCCCCYYYYYYYYYHLLCILI